MYQFKLYKKLVCCYVNVKASEEATDCQLTLFAKQPLDCCRSNSASKSGSLIEASLEASLEEIIGDIRTILQYNSQKKMLHTIVGLHLI